MASVLRDISAHHLSCLLQIVTRHASAMLDGLDRCATQIHVLSKVVTALAMALAMQQAKEIQFVFVRRDILVKTVKQHVMVTAKKMEVCIPILAQLT
eukprot:11007373-Ditylum_brightwellii.AAC.1